MPTVHDIRTFTNSGSVAAGIAEPALMPWHAFFFVLPMILHDSETHCNR